MCLNFCSRAAVYFSLALVSGMAAIPNGFAGTGSCDQIKINGSNVWFPISIRHKDAEDLSGVFPDLAQEIFQSMKVDVAFGAKVPWKRVFVQLESGEIDMVAGAYHTKDRARNYVLSSPVIKEPVAIFVRADMSDRPGSLEDLIGLQGLAPFGATFGEEFDDFANKHLTISRQSFDDFSTNMELLVDGKADYLVIARQAGEMMLKDLGAEGQVEALPWPALENSLHYMFSKKSPCLKHISAFQNELEKRVEAGEANNMMKAFNASASGQE